MSNTFSIHIPTKPYLKKYLEKLYGSPLVFDQNNLFGTTIMGYLNRKFYFRETAEITHRKFDKFNSPLTIFFPKWWLTQTHFGTDLPTQNVIYLNKHFENRFEEDLYNHCRLATKYGQQLKLAAEEFCSEYGIEVDEDITLDCLIKKYQREREARTKKTSKNFIAILSSQNPTQQNSLFFQ